MICILFILTSKSVIFSPIFPYPPYWTIRTTINDTYPKSWGTDIIYVNERMNLWRKGIVNNIIIRNSINLVSRSFTRDRFHWSKLWKYNMCEDNIKVRTFTHTQHAIIFCNGSVNFVKLILINTVSWIYEDCSLVNLILFNMAHEWN